MTLFFALGAAHCRDRSQVPPTAATAPVYDDIYVPQLAAYDYVLVEPPEADVTRTPVAMGVMGEGVRDDGAWPARRDGMRGEVTTTEVLDAIGLIDVTGATGIERFAGVGFGPDRPLMDQDERKAAARALVVYKAETRGAPVLDDSERIAGNHRLDLTQEARLRNGDIEGMRARARICITEDGTPESVEILESSGVLTVDERLRAALMDWRYRPQRLNGQAVPFCEQVTFRYEVDPVAEARPRR